jgi:hypothetical protein
MAKKDMTHGAYFALARAKQGIMPDGRTALGKSVAGFVSWVKDHFGDEWNNLQEARLSIAFPWIIFYFACPVTKEKDILHNGFIHASDRMERLLRDLVALSSRKKTKSPDISDYLKGHGVEKS